MAESLDNSVPHQIPVSCRVYLGRCNSERSWEAFIRDTYANNFEVGGTSGSDYADISSRKWKPAVKFGVMCDDAGLKTLFVT